MTTTETSLDTKASRPSGIDYKTSEKNRVPGYKQIKNIKKSIIEKVKKVLDKGEIDL